MRKPNKTKIVATIGPKTCPPEMIEKLLNAGATMFRINTSHEEPVVHAERIAVIRDVAKKMNMHVPILIDLQGPKIRVGKMDNPVEIKAGELIKIRPELEQTDPNIIPVDYLGISSDVKPGDSVLLDDGKLAIEILEVQEDLLTAKVVHGGLLKPRKGMNIPGSTASISVITERDINFIKFAVEQDVDYLALSFVREKEDVLKAKHYIKEFGGNIPIISKIEKPQAVDNLVDLITASEGVMVARGDLGIEISPEKVPIVQKDIIKEANRQRKVVIVATQMLESMIDNPIPTRAEASDIANAILDGTDAVMLSGETAVGDFPVGAVEMMGLISDNVENSSVIKTNLHQEQIEVHETDSQALASAIIRMLDEIEINAIVAFTKTGYTARLLSKFKPKVPIIALSDNEQVCRRVKMFWDVFPHIFASEKDLDKEALARLDKELIENTFVCPGDKVVITGSIPYISTGKTNFIRLHQVGSTATMY